MLSEMEFDDDMFVVIVGEDEELDTSNLENLKETVLNEKSGFMEVDGVEQTLEECEDFDINIVKEENKESEYESVNDGTDDDETLPRYCDSDDHNMPTKEKEPHRYSMLKPWQQKSFVQELRQQYPELKNNKKLLIDTLSEIMRSVKPPPPPQDYFIMNGCQFECVICGRISESIPAAGRHYQERHGQRYLVCYACGVDFRSKTNLYKHEKRCSARDAVIVLKARALFIGPRGKGRPFLPALFKTPKKPASPRQTFGCNLCSATFISKVGLESHENLHKGIRPYTCPHCPAAYTARSALTRHVAKHTDVQYICDHCGRSFKVKAGLVTHMNMHAPLKKYPCEECDKRFAQKQALRLHIDRTHRNLPPPFKCQLCPRRYPRMSLLKNHMRKVHGMDLMTRKMFFKSLPMMSQEKLQNAKVVLHSELLTNSNESIIVCEDITEPEKAVAKSKTKTRARKKAQKQEKRTTIKIEIEEDVGSPQTSQTQNIESSDRLSDPSEIKEEHIMNSEELGNDKALHIENKEDDTKISNVDTKTKPLNMEVKKLTMAANKDRYSKERNILKRKFKN